MEHQSQPAEGYHPTKRLVSPSTNGRSTKDWSKPGRSNVISTISPPSGSRGTLIPAAAHSTSLPRPARLLGTLQLTW